jgi:hypothetical protein
MQAREARRYESEDALQDAVRVLDLGPHLGPDPVFSPLKLVHHRACADATAIQIEVDRVRHRAARFVPFRQMVKVRDGRLVRSRAR